MYLVIRYVNKNGEVLVSDYRIGINYNNICDEMDIKKPETSEVSEIEYANYCSYNNTYRIGGDGYNTNIIKVGGTYICDISKSIDKFFTEPGTELNRLIKIISRDCKINSIL